MNDFRKSIFKLAMVLVAIVGVLVIVILVSNIKTKTIGYTETGLVNAAKKYYKDNPSQLPINDYEEVYIEDSKLVSEKYLKQFKDEYDTIVRCNSKVTVTKIKDEYFYQPYLKCDKGTNTQLLYEEIINSKDNGLYKTGDEYYFKGENPNNHLTFANMNWKIIKIDKDGNIKIIHNDFHKTFGETVWDDRYNINYGENIGINDYEVSRVRDYLNEKLEDKDLFTKYDLSRLQKTNLCIGKRGDKDKTKDGNTECSKKLENQLIGLIQLNEYFNASLDENCLTKDIDSCQNYNYLSRSTWSITPYNGDTSRVWVSSSSVFKSYASNSRRVLPVVTLKSDTILNRGDGTENNPYIIK